MSTEGKKRPRADLLSSLDATFASTGESDSSKYTLKAATHAMSEGKNQQAYRHLKQKRKDTKRDKGGNEHGDGIDGDNQAGKMNVMIKVKKDMKKDDPFYHKMNAELLVMGLKDCSLHAQVHTLRNPRKLHDTLKNYLEHVTTGTRAGSNAIGSLKNKVLSLDNPFKVTPAAMTGKAIASASQKQTAKLLSARRRRERGLHLLCGEMKYTDAKQLNDMWTRYVSQVIESELCEIGHITEETQRARNTKLQTKFKYLDLSGCPLEVIRSKNPCNIGLSGVVVAETQQTVQICCPASFGDDTSNNSIRTIPKFDSHFRVRISRTRSLYLDGAWFAERVQ